ncbi:MAG: NAD(P)-dependent glycerol-3-phosphate dehydrogenase [Clostridia bacterium]|nr:NAD(P)-dependent glycerol-3-phosphate dehydrogenase [Clostridia bacterium]MBQ5813301.1 NAD(P)-dependent glycerol-3-phosphate dehydrogenase [Clostridia bacterium]
MKISVIGCGGWGLAVSSLLESNGHDVSVWCFLEDEYNLLTETRGNEKLLPGVKLSENIRFTMDMSCAQGCGIVVVAVPSFAVYSTALKLKEHIAEDTVVVLLSKGFDKSNGYCLLSDSLRKALGEKGRIVALTGPSHAEEVSRGVPTAIVAASEDIEAAKEVQAAFMNGFFRVYTHTDIVGAELGGAMKNIMALAVGISDGAGYGDNTKAMLMTRGIAEMSRFGEYLGGQKETFGGLSGVGDLIVTCTSNHSRNRRAGLMIGAGEKPDEAVKKVGAVVEGYFATEAVHHLAQGSGIELPLSEAMYGLLFENKTLKQTATELFARAGKSEFWK